MKTFILDHIQIDITEEAEAYNTLRNKYKKKAKAISTEFNNKWGLLFENIDEVHEKCPNIAQEYLLDIVDTAIRDLIAVEITDISDSKFISDYVTPRITWQSDFAIIDDQYMEIILDSDAYEEYKKSRSSGGGGVMGGGFGVEGAVAGMAIATAANLAIGAVSGILNATADGIRTIGVNKLKKDLFDNIQTRKHLAESIYNLVFNVHFAVLDVIKSRNLGHIYENVPVEQQEKSMSIVENIKRKRIEINNIKSSLIDAIKLDRYNNEAYSYWINNFPSDSSAIDTLVDYFCIDIDKQVISPSLSEDSDKEKLENTNNENNSVVDELDEQVFDGVKFDTVAEANKVRAQYVDKFLKSGKKIDEGKKNEFKKIFKNDESVSSADSKLGCIGGLGCLTVFIPPFWPGIIIFIIIMSILIPYGNSKKKTALKNWLKKQQNYQ